MPIRARRNYRQACEAMVSLVATKGRKTLAELVQICGTDATQITAWRAQLIEGAVSPTVTIQQ